MIPHKKYMQMAISLAKKGGSAVCPNPLVGCVIVKRGQVVGKGYHKVCGGSHAERVALQDAGKKAKDAIMYVTLEPCSHWGRTPPCTEEIVNAGIREIIIGMKDPNPKVNGYEVLKLRGLKTRIGMLEEECQKMNEAYIKFVKKGLPFVTLKAGMTIDGKIATVTGSSKYITGPESLKMVHRLRHELGVVIIGIDTLLKDDPLLDTRHIPGGIEPVKVIIDSELKIPTKAKVFKKPEKVIVVCLEKASKDKKRKLEQMGARIIVTKSKNKMVDMEQAMKELANMGYYNVLLEGGSMLNASMIKDKLVDKVMLFTSPKILGNDAKGVIGPLGIKELKDVVTLKDIDCMNVGKDILIEGYI